MIKDRAILHDVQRIFPLLKEKLRAQKDLVFAYIFGSYGLGEPGPMSDVDVAVYLKNSKDYFERKIELNLLITETLRTDEVDIAILNEAPIEFAFNILKTSTLLFSKNEDLRVNYETKIMKFYQDFEYCRKRMIRDYMKKAKEELQYE